VFRLQNGIVAHFSVKDGLPDARVAGLYRDRSGNIWTAGWKGISNWNGTRFVGDPRINAVVGYATMCTEDRNGNVWVASSSGLVRVHAGKVTMMDHNSGLSGDFVSDVFEDREGDLWVATRAGLDRLRDGQIRTFTPQEGLIHDSGPLVADTSNGVWTISGKKIAQIAADKISIWPFALPSGRKPLTMLSRPDSRFLAGFDGGARYWGAHSTASAPEMAGLNIRSMLQAHDGSIWIGTANRGLVHWSPASRSFLATGVPDRFIVTLAEDRAGDIWAGSFFGGGLYRVAGPKVEHFGREEGLPSPNIYTLFVDDKGKLWIGSPSGLSWFQGGRIRTTSTRDGLQSDLVWAIIDDAYDRLWFAGYGGLETIEKKSLTEWGDGLRDRVIPRVYPRTDGLQVTTIDRPFPNAVRSADGHLWFCITDGMLEVAPSDPAASRDSRFRVLVEDATIDRVPNFEPDRIRILPGARAIELRFTALTLSSPETVRFRYRLEGFDDDWIDAGVRRVAYYNNLKPGTYTFKVQGSPGAEQWLESPPLLLEQLPFFYQTWWFRSLTWAAALSLALFLYRLRVHQIAREFNARLEERVSERTRLARDLHDTLLQSFHGLMLRFQVVSKMLPEGKAREQLEKTLERADQAIAEGRNAVYDLRSSTTTTNDLAEALNAVANELSGEGTATFDLVLEGGPRDLHPIIRDELYRISREALLNAFKHARARQIEAEINYGERVFRLRIRDDGEGMPAEILEQGRPGHFGLPGMRERARQVGADLNIWSRAGTGTEIDLSLAGSIAYGTSPRPSRLRIFGKKVG
jgi:signal transduction histidine kinase